MYVAVREKSEEMKYGIVVLYVCDEFLPCCGIKHFAACDCLRNKLCALCENLSGAESVVSDLAVAHVVVGGKSDCGAVSLEKHMRVLFPKHIKSRGICRGNGVAGFIGCISHTVHYDGEDWSFFVSENGILHK